MLSTALALAEATRIVSGHGHELRVIRLDGEALPVTSDHKATRVNVVVRAGRVARVDGLY